MASDGQHKPFSGTVGRDETGAATERMGEHSPAPGLGHPTVGSAWNGRIDTSPIELKSMLPRAI